jgi:hypothetical protein
LELASSVVQKLNERKAAEALPEVQL